MIEPVLHDAGEPEGLVQKCKRCGYVLANHEGAMFAVGGSPGFWATGPITVWHGNPTQLAAGIHDNAIACGSKPN